MSQWQTCNSDCFQEAVMFEDLSPEVQKMVLYNTCVNDPVDVRWDVFPLFYVKPDTIHSQRDCDEAAIRRFHERGRREDEPLL